MINVFLVVKHRQSRCVVTTQYICTQLQLTICCRYDVNQDTITYGEVKQSVFTNTQTSEPEYEVIARDHKLIDYDVKMDDNPAYQATSELQSQTKSQKQQPGCVTIAIYIYLD